MKDIKKAYKLKVTLKYSFYIIILIMIISNLITLIKNYK